MANSEIARILVVDDESLNRQVLNEVLGSHYTVLEAKDGEQALRRARAEQAPDLILLDIMMPKMDGFEVLGSLKADPATADIPVIFITGKDSQLDEESGLGLGAVDYITRPFSAPLVLQRVQNRLDLVCTARALNEIAARNKRLLSMMATDLKHSIAQVMGFAKQLKHSADVDSPNRQVIAAQAEQLLEAANRAQKLLEALLE